MMMMEVTGLMKIQIAYDTCFVMLRDILLPIRLKIAS